MKNRLSHKDSRHIENGIRDKYSRVAVSPAGQFNYPTGRAGLEALKYDPVFTDRLTDDVAEVFCGVGNPFSLHDIGSGDAVLDIGCGAGVDTIIAAMMVGIQGQAIGIDLVPQMVQRAEKNRLRMGLENVSFLQADAATIEFDDHTFDAVISNGVFNLIPDKAAALQTVFRRLKPGGWLMLADQIATGPVAEDLSARVASWFRWEGGAIPGKDFLAMLEDTGFEEVALVAETGLNSSPKTKGVLVRGQKPAGVVG